MLVALKEKEGGSESKNVGNPKKLEKARKQSPLEPLKGNKTPAS